MGIEGGGETGDEGDETDAERGVRERPEKPAARPTRRARAKSAALWGLVGGFAFLALAQGFLLVASDLPVGYVGLAGLAASVAVASGGIAYATEHRLRANA
ncbi:hypothetical protein [Halorubrum depositum]|uniref:hypothetical protein n=1 Tax=Halorubrum depositum TaxID=2583992 RepID=UPI0011A3BB42|nr:hypothetical protein [Halorubrum depositum]